MQTLIRYIIIVLPACFMSCISSVHQKREVSSPTPDPKIVEIRIKCFPHMADFYFDDYYINGKGELFDSEKGYHRVRASLNGYVQYDQIFDIQNDFELVVRLEPVPTNTPCPIYTFTPYPSPTVCRVVYPNTIRMPDHEMPYKATPKPYRYEDRSETRDERIARRLEQGIANGYDWRTLTYEEKKTLCIIFSGIDTSFNLNWGILIICADEYYSDRKNLKEKIGDVLGFCGLINIILNEPLE
ncbi:hypothetical protein JXA40_04465 [bacterium]|nr:hypothetical protein [candidate division CSSED10-310 bacterium]